MEKKSGNGDLPECQCGGLGTFHAILFGGWDSDHSFSYKTTVMGDDPYLPLYEKMALWLIAREARKQRDAAIPELKLKMGDILESCGAHGSVHWFIQTACYPWQTKTV